MNRAERRKKCKVTQGQLERMATHNINTGFAEGKADALNVAAENFSVAIAYVMYYKLNYPEGTCKVAINLMQDVFKQLNTKELNIDEVKKKLEADINLSFAAAPSQP